MIISNVYTAIGPIFADAVALLERLKLNYVVKKIRDLAARQWEVKFQHAYRESNRCADFLAHLGRSQSSKKSIWLTPPHRDAASLVVFRVRLG